MLLVPLRGDYVSIIGLADQQLISSYSALKVGGAVYLKRPLDPKIPYASISAIEAINGVIVTQLASGLFQPKGLIKRKLNLPQIGDVITVLVSRSVQGVEEVNSYKVTDLKLANKPLMPLEVLCSGSRFSLSEIIDIKRSQGSERFDLLAFKTLYLDYLPI